MCELDEIDLLELAILSAISEKQAEIDWEARRKEMFKRTPYDMDENLKKRTDELNQRMNDMLNRLLPPEEQKRIIRDKHFDAEMDDSVHNRRFKPSNKLN